MSLSLPGLVDSIDTSTDLSTHQYKVLKADGSLCGVAEVPAGINQEDPNGSVDATVAPLMITGISRGIAGAAFVLGAKLSTDATGRLITAVVGGHVVGIARVAATAANEVVSCQLQMGGSAL